jgi:3-methylcrotonyl-CoA carboxylase alpha subunit
VSDLLELGPVLVANRGEIAIRIMRTCRRLGLKTVAVYSDADARSRHVAAADSALYIGPSPAPQSYLDHGRILAAANQSGARSVHPGYGFLAENADFAQSVLDAGLVWIGPPPAAMRALGDKAHAKALAERHDVPVLPGYHREDQSLETLIGQAERIGYPLLVKASAGGGGRGMRVVESHAEFAESLEAARREARTSFGDDRVLLEPYVRRPRHVEVQIVGDRQGNLVHLGERECSIQRRHQKLIEESPSPAVDADLRNRMGEAALRLARAAGYASAGTVEFLLQPDGRFSFLEVNARLQVEHPVTEALTGLDLVELQLRAAAGEPLAIAQSDVRFDGHAIEARVIAEDPRSGFLPSSGTLERFEYPDFVRVDTWVASGATISPFYDSLLAKVIAHAPTRQAALASLAHALREMRVEGVHHNVDLLLATIEAPPFQRGELDTAFLAEHHVVEQLSDLPLEVLAAASAIDHLRPTSGDPWHSQGSWRLGRVDQPASWTRAGVTHHAVVSAELGGPGVRVSRDGRQVVAQLVSTDDAAVRRQLLVDGRGVSVWDHGNWRVVEWQGRSFRLHRSPAVSVEESEQDTGAAGAAGRLTAPMPGRIVKVAIRDGEHVLPNQLLVVLEAMKMEHLVEAPRAGVVTDLHVREGDQVPGGAPLLTLGSPVE